MTPFPSDQELLELFKNAATKEQAFTDIIKKIPGKIVLAHPQDGYHSRRCR